MQRKDWFRRMFGQTKNRRVPHAWWETAAEFPAEEEAFGGRFDPLGSYTGTPDTLTDDGDTLETPEQDADDL
ncbi:MAG: hypothetical protein LBR73_05020 [Oscillospiraceae bacterium]|nr:hypothetical protein [Oscillospiraceae bacterium]